MLVKSVENHSHSLGICLGTNGKASSVQRNLRTHELAHKKEKCFCCSVYGKAFRSKVEFQGHTKKTSEDEQSLCAYIPLYPHGNEVRRYVHQKNFTDPMVYRLTHTGEKPFACRICGKAFAHRSVLSTHELIHSREKPFPCRICGKAFADRSALARHKLTHTEEKPVVCRICGKSFAQSRHLSSHKLKHTGERPFSCSVCGKGFNRQSNLRRHEFTHKKEKRFHCS
ncbi:unnamed protein product, partial [Cyprideis torosa]